MENGAGAKQWVTSWEETPQLPGLPSDKYWKLFLSETFDKKSILRLSNPCGFTCFYLSLVLSRDLLLSCIFSRRSLWMGLQLSWGEFSTRTPQLQGFFFFLGYIIFQVHPIWIFPCDPGQHEHWLKLKPSWRTRRSWGRSPCTSFMGPRLPFSIACMKIQYNNFALWIFW